MENVKNKLILFLFSEECHKNSMLGSQNGPLTDAEFECNKYRGDI